MKILLYIDIATFINENDRYMTKNALRKQQIIKGLNKLFEYDFLGKGCDILITDNTCEELPQEIIDTLPKNTIFRCFNNNKVGCINKGTGLIQKWLYNQEIILRYDYIIHFEGRLELKSHKFFESFFNNSREIFRFGDPDDKNNHTHFFTGLFSIKSNNLLKFCNSNNIHNMLIKYISIEYPMRDMFINKVDIMDELDLIWYPANGKIVYF